MIELNKIYNEDCLVGMSKIPDGSVDMILCDLPYGITACHWDTIIPLEPLWEHYKRVIKPNGAIVLTASQPFTTDLINSNRKWFKYEWIWDKINKTGFMLAKQCPLRRHENILIFSMGKLCSPNRALIPSQNPMVYNPQNITPNGNIMKGKKRRVNDSRRRHDYDYKLPVNDYIKEFSNYPSSIIDINNKEINYFHPTQKPVALFEYLIRTYTNEGETVLDNCMGSGTTAIACIRSGRQYIGFETDKQYNEKSLIRIEHELQKVRLF